MNKETQCKMFIKWFVSFIQSHNYKISELKEIEISVNPKHSSYG